MRLKLLYIAPQNPYPPIDGGKISIYFPIIYLSKIFDIYFAFLYNPNNNDIEKVKKHFNEFGIKILALPHNTQSDLKYLLKNFFKKEPFKWDKYYSFKFQKILTETVKKENISYVLVSHPHVAKYAINLKKNFPYLKIFLREHNIEFKLVEQFKNYTKNPLYKLISFWQYVKSKKLEIEYWKEFNKVFFISDLDYNIALKALPNHSDKFEVIYDGFELNVNKNTGYIENSFIYTANLKTIQNAISFKWFIKNIWIPNLSHWKKRHIKLYITGNSRDLICKVANIKFIENFNIINLGFVENINKEILKYKYVLSPTIIGSGLRLKILNGMACGKPVFVTPLDLSTCKVFKDMENLVCFKDKNNFLKKILLLEENSKLYLRISTNAIETIKTHFSWQKYAEKISRIIFKYENT